MPDVVSPEVPEHQAPTGGAAGAATVSTALILTLALQSTADGAVGDPDPMKAIDNTLTDRRFDEIILSTLPPGLSRWLAWDLRHRLRRKTDIQLTVITSAD